VASIHCTMCGKDLPLITSSRPRTVREPTALGTSFLVHEDCLLDPSVQLYRVCKFLEIGIAGGTEFLLIHAEVDSAFFL